MALSHSPQIVTNGLVLALDAANQKSYNTVTSTSTWYDLSGNNKSGTLNGNITYYSTNSGFLSFGLVSTTIDYVSLPANSINTNADLTLNYWVKTPLPGSGGAYTLSSGYTANSHLQVRYVAGGALQIIKSQITYMGTFSGFTAVSNAIYFLTITLTKSTNTWSLYVNGSFVSSFVSAQTFTTTSPTLGINGLGNEERFAGNFYSFSYYNRALSAAEVSQNFNAYRGRFGI